MSASRRPITAPTLFALFLSFVLAPAAGAGRLERPATDASPEAPSVLPRPPFVFAPTRTPWVIDPANPMREIAPGVYEGIVPVRLPDGSWRVDLDERFLQFAVARRAADGGLAHSCVGGFTGLALWQGAPAAYAHTPAVAAAPVLPAPPAVQPVVTTPTGSVPAQWEAQ